MLETVGPKYNEITMMPSEAPTFAPVIPRHGGSFKPIPFIILTTEAPSALETVGPKYNEITMMPSEAPTFAPVIPKRGGIYKPVPIIVTKE
jgi:hypothetical protein